MAAFAFLGAAPQIVPYSVLDLVSGVHSAIVGWNVIATSIGEFCAALLGVPDIPPEVINALIIGLTIGPAFAFVIFNNERNQHQGLIQNAAFYMRIIGACLGVILISLFAITEVLSSTATEPDVFASLEIISLLIIFFLALRSLPNYRLGFLTVIGFVVTLEIVYLLSTESTQAKFESFVCNYESSALPKCIGRE